MKRWIERRMIPKVGATLIQLLGSSIRLHIHDPHGFLDQHDRAPVLFAFWHNRLFLLPYLQRRLLRNFTLVALVSRSRDGNMITDIIRRFGLRAARGSSSRKGSQALMTLMRSVEREGVDVAISPDGPRGPRQKLQQGVLHLAKLTGRPIIPLRMEFSRKIELNSWDRFQIPWPFARCDFYFGTPVLIPSTATDDDLAQISTSLTTALGE
jgi:lysophospholipid acyltransferase (LPLAT)-like uncharacterized protein